MFVWVARVVASLVLSVPLLAGWQAIGPFGGAAAVVQIDAHHAGTVLAATTNALLFRSSDDGEHWGSVHFPAQLHSVLHAFIVDTNSPDTYLIGVSGDSPEITGLFRTTDAGATWTLLPGLRGKEVWSVAIWPGDSKVIAAGTHGGVFLTRDGGENWAQISSPANREMDVVVSLAFDPVDSNILFAGTPHLPWKTNNGGVLWRSVHTGMLDDSDVFSINVDRFRPQRVFASACSGIYNSVNGGASWTKLTGARGASYRTYFVSQDPREPETVFAGTTHGLVKSVDGGQTWRQLSTHLTRYVAFDSRQRRRIFVATDDDGIERSDDEGETLRAVNEGFCNRHLPALAATGDALYTNTMYEAANGGVFKFGADGSRWETVAPASRLLGQQLLALVSDGANAGRLYAASYTTMLVSKDDGKSWNPLPGGLGKSRMTAILGPDAGSQYLLAATENGLFRSADNGRIWKRMELPSPSQSVRYLARLSSSQVAAVTPSGLFLSADGLEWKAAAALPGNAEVYQVIADGNTLFAASSAGLMRMNDSGATWELVLEGLQRSTVRAVCKHPSQPGVLFAAQYGDVYESTDHGNSWSRISPENSGVSIKEFAIVPARSDRLFVLTQRQGVFALPLEAIASGASNLRGLPADAGRGINEK